MAALSKKELLDQRDRVIARHPKTTFVAAHVAECGENLARCPPTAGEVSECLIDIGAGLGTGTATLFHARSLLNFPDRILFGADLVPEESMYRLYFRFLETADEYFDYPSHASRQAAGRSRDRSSGRCFTQSLPGQCASASKLDSSLMLKSMMEAADSKVTRVSARHFCALLCLLLAALAAQAELKP